MLSNCRCGCSGVALRFQHVAVLAVAWPFAFKMLLWLKLRGPSRMFVRVENLFCNLPKLSKLKNNNMHICKTYRHICIAYMLICITYMHICVGCRVRRAGKRGRGEGRGRGALPPPSASLRPAAPGARDSDRFRSIRPSRTPQPLYSVLTFVCQIVVLRNHGEGTLSKGIF